MATQYYANTHPSIGNYLMLTTGQVLTNNGQRTPSSLPVSANERGARTGGCRQNLESLRESLPSVGYLGGDTTSGGGQYYVRHVPLLTSLTCRIAPRNSKNLVPFTHFATDLAAATCPTTPSSLRTAAMMATIVGSALPTAGSRATSIR